MSFGNFLSPARKRGYPTRGRYLVHHRAWNSWLRANDFLLELMVPQRPAKAIPMPRRVLIAVGGHVGDAVISTSLFAPLRSAIPDVEIGILSGSWSRSIFAGHPAVKRVHTMDHWKANRSAASLGSRWLVARRTRAQAIAEIRASGYDAAVDLAPYYPNSARLLWRAGVPVRVGFTSGGDGALYTHPVEWTEGRHTSGDHLALLRTLIPDVPGTTPLRYELPDPPHEARARAEQLLRGRGIAPGEYVVAHIGAGLALREWPLEKWRVVVLEIASKHCPVVLTGAGPRQAQMTAQLTASIPNVVDLCDRINWDEFRWVLKRARLAICVETVAMHLATAARTPCIALMTAMEDPQRWRPLGDVTVLSEAVPCAPCYRSRGCADMSCVRDISPSVVLAAARRALNGGLQ